MDRNDAEALADLLLGAYLVKGQPTERVTSEMVHAWIRTLPDIPLEHVDKALHYHARDPEYRFAPTPSDVLQIIRERTGGLWPAADEAWAIAIQAMDEGATVVWTEEIAEAWGAAQSVMQGGDEVGARMAFRDCYRRLVRQAQEQGRKPRAWASLGHEVERRAPALQEAVNRGLLTEEQAQMYLPPPEDPEGKAIAGLLGGKVSIHPSSSAVFKARLESLRNAIRKPEAKPSDDPWKEADIDRKRAAAAKMAERARD